MALIYKGTNKINGKSYIGQTKRTLEWRLNNAWCGHYKRAESLEASESCIASAIKKYGKENFDWTILEFVDISNMSKEEAQKILDDREIYWIKKYDSYNHGYNRNRGGHTAISIKGRQMTWSKKIWASRYKNGTDKIIPWNKGKTMPKSYCLTMSKIMLEKWKNPLYKNKMFTLKHCKNLSKAVSKQWSNKQQREKKILGIQKSWLNQERRDRVSKLFSGPKTEEHKKKLSESSKGRIWVTNGTVNHLTKNYQKYIDQGWSFGRTVSDKVKAGAKRASSGRRWINNGQENKFVKDYSTYIKQGWSYGRITI